MPGEPRGFFFGKSRFFPAALDDAFAQIVIEQARAAPTPLCRIDFQQTGGALADVDNEATAFWGRDSEWNVPLNAITADPARDREACVAWGRDTMAALAPASIGVYSVELRPGFPETRAEVDAAFGGNLPGCARSRPGSIPTTCSGATTRSDRAAYPPRMDIQFLDVIPVVACEDIAATHDFLVDALGFVSAGLERDGTGQVVHGEVRAGEHRIWLHMTTAEAGLATPTSLGGSGGGNVIQVVDVDAHFERRARPARPSCRSPPTRTTANASTACATPTATAGGSPRRPRRPPPADRGVQAGVYRARGRSVVGGEQGARRPHHDLVHLVGDLRDRARRPCARRVRRTARAGTGWSLPTSAGRRSWRGPCGRSTTSGAAAAASP